MTVADVAQAEAIRADAERRLAELQGQRRRLAADARFDAECRDELEAVDREIDVCRRELNR